MIDIYVINLKEREDRLEKLITNFKEYTNINLSIVEAVKYNPGVIGCFMSHQKIIKYAKENNMKNIIVMEDDCIPHTPIFEEKLINIKKYLDENDNWDIFLGGGTLQYKNIIKKHADITGNISLYKIHHSFDGHFVCYNNTIYDTFINADPTILPLDHFWRGKNIRFVIVIPFIAIQDSSYSNILNRFVKNVRYAEVEYKLLKKLDMRPL